MFDAVPTMEEMIKIKKLNFKKLTQVLKDQVALMNVDILKMEAGNKTATQRIRTRSVRIAEILKEFREKSLRQEHLDIRKGTRK